MDLPQPPDEIELKNIIDKLANFVARNGPEFEQMTKQKQKDNPKFSFLFGGEHFNYYQCKVTTEQAILNQHKQKAVAMIQQINQQQQQPPPWQQVPPQVPQQVPPGQIPLPQAVPGNSQPVPNPQEQQLQQQIQTMEQQLQQERDQMNRQITESEGNLAAHHAALMRLKENQIDQAIEQAREEDLLRLCQECDTNVGDLDKMVQPIIEACTKDNISGGKNWIFSHSITPEHGDMIAQYLLKRVSMPNANFEMRLHLIYLMNDVLHHCVRKNMEDLLRSMRKVVVAICHITFIDSEEEKKQKLTKLVNLWEQHKYFDKEIIRMLKEPKDIQAVKELWRRDYPHTVDQVSKNISDRYNQLQMQHQEFVSHLQGQVHKLEGMVQQQQSTLQQLQAQNQAAAAIALPTSTPSSLPNQAPSQNQTQIPGIAGINTSQPPPNMPQGFEPQGPGFQAPPQQPGPQTFDYSHGPTPTPVVQEYNHGQQAPPGNAGGLPLPDFSRPPPGFPPSSIGGRGGPPQPDAELTSSLPYYDLPGGLIAPMVKDENDGRPKPTPLLEMNIAPPTMAPPQQGAGTENLTPTVPYFDLPAALLAPLVKLEDHEYKPLDPKDIRLPPPVPPSDRLLAAVEAFYSQPTHERPRDSEGWEKLGLFEFYKAKEAAKKMKAEKNNQKQNGTSFRENSLSRSRSRSNSPSSTRSSSNSRARSRSKSHSRSPSPINRSPPRRRYRSRTRSKSPEIKGLPHMASYTRKSRSRSRSESPSGSESRSGSSRSRSQSRSRSSTPPRYNRRRSRSRSPSPPSFMNMPATGSLSRLGNENKGHQLLTKMGWGGAGLGKAEQGRVDPIQAADARDKVDLYKGIGMDMKDPFEQFRKNKAEGFIHRMRSRDKSDN